MTGISKPDNKIKLIIFDFDGVIITGSHEGYFTCYHKALEAVGVKLPPQEEKRRILKWWGKGHVSQIEFLLKEHPLFIPKAVAAYRKCYYSPIFSENIKLVKGARNTLRKLSNKYILGIASGMMRKTMDKLIKTFEINFFKKIMTVDDIKNECDKKPSPYIINKIRNYFSADKDSIVYVCDAENDIVMARSARVTPVVVLTGHLKRGEAEKLGVNYIISNISRLEKMLSSLNNSRT